MNHRHDLKALFLEIEPLVQGMIRRYGTDPDVRADLEGEIYYRFVDIVNAYDPSRGVPLKPYIIRQLSSSIFTYARNRWRTQQREADWEAYATDLVLDDEQNPSAAWDERIVLDELRVLLPDALAHLSERQRKVVMFRYQDKLAFADIGIELGVQSSTARSILRQALVRLKRWYDAGSHTYEAVEAATNSAESSD